MSNDTSDKASKRTALDRAELAFLTKILPRAQAAGEATAYHHFVTMLNPKYRGPNFKWDGFVLYAVGWAEASCWQSFSDAEWKRWKKDIVEAARTSAEYAAKRILKASGLLEWWPDPTRAADGDTP